MPDSSIWMLYTKKADFNALAAKYNIDPVTVRVMRNRDIDETAMEKYLHATTDDMYSPHLLKDIDKAVSILKDKISVGSRIRIVGDYDIDGICSVYILFKALVRTGANADYVIPDRIKDGYGINESIIRSAADDRIDTIITCDNGIAATEQIDLAKKLGMTVIVTDHHDIRREDGREILPKADAIVNPKQEACAYPYKDICGAVVAYKLVTALYETYNIPEKEVLDMLEFAAIATVGDVMSLQDENRIIVKYGLERIKHTSNTGLKKLIEVTGIDIKKISAYHIGFVIGPCLNASGRLKTAVLALNMLLCEDEESAAHAAEELRKLNDERKSMTEKGLKEAVLQTETNYSDDKVLVVYLPGCHESIAGIIAGRLREQFLKPAFVLTDGEECIKGSGRSIENYHMFHALEEVSELLIKYGGHPMAAGLSLESSNIDKFRRRLNDNARLTDADFVQKIWVDTILPPEYISERLIDEMSLLEPFGNGNERPKFAQKGMGVRNVKVLGKNRNVIRLSLVSAEGNTYDGILFTDGDSFIEEFDGHDTIDIVYYPEINEYNGNRKLQLVIKNYKLLTP